MAPEAPAPSHEPMAPPSLIIASKFFFSLLRSKPRAHISSPTSKTMRLSIPHLAIGLLHLSSSAATQESAQQPLQLDILSTIKPHRTVDDSPLLSLHRSLVQLDSVTGKEASVGDFLVTYLESLNLTVHKQLLPPRYGDATPSKPRFNIHAHPPGHKNTRVLLTSHIDTVPPFYNYSIREPASSHFPAPSTSQITEKTEIWGRGTADAKNCVAAQIAALHVLLSSNAAKPSDLSLLFVVGEEKGGDGMRMANSLGLTPEVVIFGEPTEGKLAAGHKGFLHVGIVVRGTSAHSGYPWLGRSANDVLIAALAGLETLKGLSEADGGLPRSEKYGETTVNVGRIEGGVAPNVVAEHATADLALRLAGGRIEDVKALVLKTIEKATKGLLEDGKASLKVDFGEGAYGPVDIDTDVEGFETITVNYGTDIPSWYGKQKRYLYGPGSILVAHSDHEHLTVGELEQSVEGYKKIALAALKQ